MAGVMSDEHFDSVMPVNLRGVFVGTRAVTPHMVQGGGGVVLNASSEVGMAPGLVATEMIAAMPEKC